MSERKLVPNIRFKGFEEDWEKLKLKSCVDRIKGNDGRMDLPTLTISASNGWMSQKERFSSNIAGKEQKNYTLLKKGELAYNHGNSRLAPYGTVFELKNYKEALVPRVYHSFKTKFMIKADFLEYLFHSKKIDQELRKLITSGARMDGLLNISYDSFTSITVKAPNTSEQQKIGNLFAKLDRLLDLQQQKLDQLELLKKALLQKLFPKQGVKIPELRFKGFEDEWRKNKANKIFKSISDKHHADLAVLAASQAEGMILRDSIGIDIKYEKSSLDSYKRVMPGQFVIHLRSFQGGFAYSRYEGIISPAYTVLSFIKKEEQDSIFWKYVFLSGNFIRRLKTITYGVRDGKSISYSDFGFLFMYYPSVPEQQKIGNLLIKVDHLIEVENKKLNNLKQVKKSLLQNMFVE